MKYWAHLDVLQHYSTLLWLSIKSLHAKMEMNGILFVVLTALKVTFTDSFLMFSTVFAHSLFSQTPVPENC